MQSVKRLFKPIKSIAFDEEVMDYECLKYTMQLLERMSSILPHSFHIIDYYQEKFLFISKHSISLCGYTLEEAMRMGYKFYTKTLTPENLIKLIEIKEEGLKYFSNIPPEKKNDAFISYDLILQRKNGSSFCVNHRMKPLFFTKDNNIWLSLCCMRPSANNETGNVNIFFKETHERFSYSFSNKKWHKQESIILSDKEKFIITETNRGTLEKQQAHLLGCTRSTIQYYKHEILRKTGAMSMREAIFFLHTNDIFDFL